jgi:hypothetical protein
MSCRGLSGFAAALAPPDPVNGADIFLDVWRDMLSTCLPEAKAGREAPRAVRPDLIARSPAVQWV